MDNKDFIIEEEVLVKICQYEEVPYRMECYDGYAIGTLLDEEYQCPKTIRMEYPKLADVLEDNDLCISILKYRGLFDKTANDIHYGDIMMCIGGIVKTN